VGVSDGMEVGNKLGFEEGKSDGMEVGNKLGFDEGNSDGWNEGDSDEIGDGSMLGTLDAVTYIDGIAEG
jgi:hypothetical protein